MEDITVENLHERLDFVEKLLIDRYEKTITNLKNQISVLDDKIKLLESKDYESQIQSISKKIRNYEDKNIKFKNPITGRTILRSSRVFKKLVKEGIIDDLGIVLNQELVNERIKQKIDQSADGHSSSEDESAKLPKLPEINKPKPLNPNL